MLRYDFKQEVTRAERKSEQFKRALDGNVITPAQYQSFMSSNIAPNDESLAAQMLLEFVVIHSAGFMGMVAMAKIPRATRAAGMLGLGALTTFVPLPALGLGAPDAWTPPSSSGGLWNERPQQALAAGLLYVGGGAAIRARWFR